MIQAHCKDASLARLEDSPWSARESSRLSEGSAQESHSEVQLLRYSQYLHCHYGCGGHPRQTVMLKHWTYDHQLCLGSKGSWDFEHLESTFSVCLSSGLGSCTVPLMITLALMQIKRNTFEFSFMWLLCSLNCPSLYIAGFQPWHHARLLAMGITSCKILRPMQCTVAWYWR